MCSIFFLLTRHYLTSRLWTNHALPIKSAYFLPAPPIPVNLTNQDVDTEYTEAGHTATETDYYYEETVPLPEGEVIGHEEIPVKVKQSKIAHSSVTQSQKTDRIDKSYGEHTQWWWAQSL